MKVKKLSCDYILNNWSNIYTVLSRVLPVVVRQDIGYYSESFNFIVLNDIVVGFYEIYEDSANSIELLNISSIKNGCGRFMIDILKSRYKFITLDSLDTATGFYINQGFNLNSSKCYEWKGAV